MAHGIKEDKGGYVGTIDLGSASAPEKFLTVSGEKTEGSNTLAGNVRITSISGSCKILKNDESQGISINRLVRVNGTQVFSDNVNYHGKQNFNIPLNISAVNPVISLHLKYNSGDTGGYVSGSITANGYKLM